MLSGHYRTHPTTNRPPNTKLNARSAFKCTPLYAHYFVCSCRPHCRNLTRQVPLLLTKPRKIPRKPLSYFAYKDLAAHPEFRVFEYESTHTVTVLPPSVRPPPAIVPTTLSVLFRNKRTRPYTNRPPNTKVKFRSAFKISLSRPPYFVSTCRAHCRSSTHKAS